MGELIGGRVLLVDEAQHLSQYHKLSGTKGSGFHWLVDAPQESGFDLIFAGDLSLLSIMSEFAHIQSRVRRPVVIKSAARADMVALARTEETEGQTELALLALVGGLRDVENVIRLARIFAGADKITLSHIKAAILDFRAFRV